MAKEKEIKPGKLKGYKCERCGHVWSDKCLDPECNGHAHLLTCYNCGATLESKDKELLNQIQTDLLSSFLVGHWREISESEHRVAFERILETLNPGALRAVKRLKKECEHGRNPDLCMYCHPELGKGGDRDAPGS